jgi:hypothetical protein
MASLLGPLVHLSPVVPALTVFTLLGLATVDTLNWNGQGGTLVVDWFANFSADHRDRILRHEAGHFLVAYLLDIPVTGYTLTAWDAFRQGQLGLGGVSFDTTAIDQELQSNTLSMTSVDRYCTVWMAGAIAEMLTYGNAEGGADDRQKFRILWSQLKRPMTEAEQKEKWSSLRAKRLLVEQQKAYDALVEAMQSKKTVAECCAVIEQHRIFLAA